MSTQVEDMLNEIQKINPPHVFRTDDKGNQIGSNQTQYAEAFAPKTHNPTGSTGNWGSYNQTNDKVSSYYQTQPQQQSGNPPPQQQQQQPQNDQDAEMKQIRQRFVDIIAEGGGGNRFPDATAAGAALNDKQTMISIINQYNQYMEERAKNTVDNTTVGTNGNNISDGNPTQYELEPINNPEIVGGADDGSGSIFNSIKLPIIITILFAMILIFKDKIFDLLDNYQMIAKFKYGKEAVVVIGFFIFYVVIELLI